MADKSSASWWRRMFKRKKSTASTQHEAPEAPHDDRHEALRLPIVVERTSIGDATGGETLPAFVPPAISSSRIESLDVREDKFGLLPMRAPGDARKIPSDRTFPVDIVAIHGITGDAYNTWTDPSGKLWLKDFLPEDLPGARVYSYGYDAQVFFTKATGDIETYARTLLEHLRQELLEDDHNRPIIFICHSMGGLVIKKAIITAMLKEANYGAIRQRTYGIVFLGTPHRGSKQTTFPSLLANIANVGTPVLYRFVGRARSNLINTLKMDAGGLEKLSFDFADQLRTIKIASFIEQDVTTPASTRIVDGVTGIINCPGERVIDMQGCDHRTICRFATKNNNYRLIRGIVKEWATAATAPNKPNPRNEGQELVDELVEKCQEILKFQSIDWRRTELRDKAMPTSCAWAFDHASFQAWLDKPQGPLWIKGKPGSGKSTLMETLVEHHEDASKHPNVILLHFFFVGFGYGSDTLRQSPEGMYRTLLYQLLEQAPEATTDFKKYCGKQFRSCERLGTQFTWHENDCNIIRDFLNRGLKGLASSDKSVRIFVDAVDEAIPGTAEEVVMYLHQLDYSLRNLGLDFRVCVSSRHFPINCVSEKHKIIVENENRLDIEKYVQTQFQQRNILMRQSLTEASKLQEIEREIISRSNGIFLWVWSKVPDVVELLNKAPEQLDLVNEALNEVPPELGKIYADMLKNIIHPADRYDAYLLLDWASGAPDPMYIRQLVREVQFSDAYSMPPTETAQELRRELVKIDIRIGRFSGGLIEAICDRQEAVAEFIHSSVRVFLLEDGLVSFGGLLPLLPRGSSFSSSNSPSCGEDEEDEDGFRPAGSESTKTSDPGPASGKSSTSLSAELAQTPRTKTRMVLATELPGIEDISTSDDAEFGASGLPESVLDLRHQPSPVHTQSPLYQVLDTSKRKSANTWYTRWKMYSERHLQNPIPVDRRVKIAVLDTGIDWSNPAISAAPGNIKDYWHYGGRTLGKEAHGDVDGHGTNIVKILLNLAPFADIYVARVSQFHKERVSPDSISGAISWAVNQDVDIISMSCGFELENPSVIESLNAARLKGCVMFASSVSDSATGTLQFPTSRYGVIKVHSADGYGQSSAFNPPPSRHDNNFTFLGEGLPLELKNGNAAYSSGTSFATPVAAAIAALLLTFVRMNSEHIAKDVEEFLKNPMWIEIILQYMSSSRDAYDYVVPWKLFNDRDGDFEVASKISAILRSAMEHKGYISGREMLLSRHSTADTMHIIEELE